MPGADHYHFAGVAGVGMNAVAQVWAWRGARVTGSDRHLDQGRRLPVLDQLGAAGVKLTAQDGSALTPGTRALVVSTAIEDDNPELVAARRLRVPVLHRSEALAAAVRGGRCVAVTGTSGKSTVTGMIGWVLEALGADPGVVNGAPVLNWADDRRIGNVRLPVRAGVASGWWVIEADESDRSLLNLEPDWAVVTNISEDHFGIDETRNLFDRFTARAREGSIVMPAAAAAAGPFEPRVGVSGSAFTLGGVPFRVPLPGRHNAENALCAALVCGRLGFAGEAVADALARFRGIQRRLERVGEARGVTVLDDYAHNPAKLRAAWLAVAPFRGRVHGIWRPHGYGPLRTLMDGLAAAFREVLRPADLLTVLPVYDAGGTADRSVRSEDLVARLAAAGAPAEAVATADEAVASAVRRAREGDVVMTMGARDPDLPALARRIVAGLRGRC